MAKANAKFVQHSKDVKGRPYIIIKIKHMQSDDFDMAVSCIG